jgi:hypothetical protein
MKLDIQQFIEYTKPDHLTFGDLKKMKRGDELDVVIWDDNFEKNGIETNIVLSMSYNPHKFFQWNHHKIIYKGNMLWIIEFNHGKSIMCPVHLGFDHKKTTYWHKIKNGYVDMAHDINDDEKENKDIFAPSYIHYKKFLDSMRIGWRGPMMLWNDLKKYNDCSIIRKFDK